MFHPYLYCDLCAYVFKIFANLTSTYRPNPMLASTQLKSNPSLFVFLPLFYTVWSDAILTPSEVAVLEGLIQSQQWITDNEKAFLLSQVNPASPPSPDDLMGWRDEIKKAADQTDGKSLVDI